MSLPAVFGAIALESRHAIHESFPAGPALIGAAVAFVTGVVAIAVLRRVVISGRFALFAIWTLPLALATLAQQAEALKGSAEATLAGLANNIFVGLLGVKPLVAALHVVPLHDSENGPRGAVRTPTLGERAVVEVDLGAGDP